MATGTKPWHLLGTLIDTVALSHGSCTMTEDLTNNRFDVVTNALHVVHALAHALF